MCLRARRLVERGVRFVQLYCGSGSQWDAHRDLEGNHTKLCARSDKPVAGLITDLKRRGLLDQHARRLGRRVRPDADDRGDRRPRPQSLRIQHVPGRRRREGRDDRTATTDEFGLNAVEDKVHVHDLHATILHLLGLDHKRLTFLRDGRDERLTVNGGNVVKAILA